MIVSAVEKERYCRECDAIDVETYRYNTEIEAKGYASYISDYPTGEWVKTKDNRARNTIQAAISQRS